MNISVEIMDGIFYFSNNRAFTHFGIESIVNIAANIWNKIPNEIKET